MPARKVRRHPPDWLVFLEPDYPSANMVLIRGEHPILVDTGFGGNLPETENLLRGAGAPPEELALIVNTHYHCDHVGGNGGLQRRYGTPIAAHSWDADLVNRRDREVCSAEWLDQPVEPYRVDRPLSGGDEIETGSVSLQVLHTPEHTLGHVSLYEPEDRILILGDAMHKDDVAWINPFREGIGVLQRTLETLDKLADLPVHRAYSGHGPAIEDLGVTIQGARQRYTKWLDEPRKAHWHGCKRIFAYALMIKGGHPGRGNTTLPAPVSLIRRLRSPRLRSRTGGLRRAACSGDDPLGRHRVARRKADRLGPAQVATGELAVRPRPAQGLAENVLTE